MFQIRWTWSNIKGDKGKYVTALVLSVFVAVLTLVNPKLTQVIVDEVIIGVTQPDGTVLRRTEILIPLFIIISIMALISSGLSYLRVLLFEATSQNMIVRIRKRLFSNLEALDLEYYDRNRIGDIMTRLTGDLDMVRHVVSYVVRELVTLSTLFVIVIIFFFTISVPVTLSLLIVAPALAIVSKNYITKIREIYVIIREKLATLNSSAQENIEGNRVVRAFAREGYESERFKEKNEDYKQAQIDAQLTWARFFPYIESLAQSFTVITILVGGLFMIFGEITAGELYIYTSLSWTISAPMRQMGPLLTDLQRFFASANKVIEVYYAQPNIATRHDARKTDERISGRVEFKDVSFQFRSVKVPAFEHVSFTAEPGQTIGIMGDTGSGKTALVNLIPRFYNVTSGQVLVDGTDVRMWDLISLRHNIGMATQDVFLYSDTIEGNIAFGDPDMPVEEVYEFARVASADFIQKTESGFDTIVGERGVGLSGGQKQRISLARALAIKPSILILDDTTSALDLETEKQIQENLAELPFSCTKFIIAQRISSVKNADKIIILKDGKIEETGTHRELLERHGYYYEICRLQHEVGDEFQREVAALGQK